MKSSRSVRRMSGVFVASLLTACSTLHVGQSPEAPAAPQAGEQCIADFYLPYAALAADVYRTRGAAIERLQLVVNDDLVRKITNGKGITRDALTSLYTRAREQQCRGSQNAGASGSPESLRCLGEIREPDKVKEIFNAGDEGFEDAIPEEDSQCDDRSAARPKVPIREAAREFGWERARELEKYAFTRDWRVFVPDFAIEVWRRIRKDPAAVGQQEYAIVFRGTAGYGGWFSNLRPITALLPGFWDHYKQAEASARRIVEQIYMIEFLRYEWQLSPEQEEFGPRPRRDGIELPLVTLVGHSLGAGLARYAYLRVPEATRVVGFNPSPVDGGHTLFPLAARDGFTEGRRQDPGAFCVAPGAPPPSEAPSMFFLHEKGDALTEIAPCFSGPEWGSEGGPVALCQGVDLSHGSALRQHAMNIMACRLSVRYFKDRKGSAFARQP